MRLPTIFSLLALAGSLTACSRPAEFMREPVLSPVGAGLLVSDADVVATSAIAGSPEPMRAKLSDATSLYTDKRVGRVGDILTVNISINDKASFGNATDRSRTQKTSSMLDWTIGLAQGGSAAASVTPSKIGTDTSSASSMQGQGDINRSEQIQVSVAAVVTSVLPNGNLVISGTQEVRVNFELRQLTVAGIVRPYDISRNNTIAYDRIAEARVSYGGRGRLTDVQQPTWGMQLYDDFRPY